MSPFMKVTNQEDSCLNESFNSVIRMRCTVCKKISVLLGSLTTLITMCFTWSASNFFTINRNVILHIKLFYNSTGKKSIAEDGFYKQKCGNHLALLCIPD